MHENLHLGRIAGVDVGTSWTVLVILALITQGLAAVLLPQAVPHRSAAEYWLTALLMALLFLAALLAHETAHAVVAQRRGIHVEGITLWALGGVTRMSGEPSRPRDALAVAAAGPLTSLAAGVVAGLAAWGAHVASAPAILVAGLAWLASVNVLLAVFNLLPAAPLDGGRVLAALLWARSGDRERAAVSAARAGRVVGGALVALGALEVFVYASVGGLWLMLVGWFVAVAARAEEQTVTLRDELAGLTVGDVMSTGLRCAPAQESVQSFLGRVGLHERYQAFPLVEPGGTLAGMVSLDQLSRVPAAERAVTTLREVATPLDHVLVATPDEPLVDVVGRWSRGRLVVVDDGHAVGLLSPSDIARILQRVALRRAPGAGTGAAPP